MKRLSARQALNCEQAKNKRCRCRCGGVLHGKARIAVLEEASQLPEEDAHHANPPQARRPRAPWDMEPLW